MNPSLESALPSDAAVLGGRPGSPTPAHSRQAGQETLLCAKPSITERILNLVWNLLYWVLFTAVVFAGCYWFVSQIGRLLIASGLLSADAAFVMALVLGALMTPAIIFGVVSLLKELCHIP